MQEPETSAAVPADRGLIEPPPIPEPAARRKRLSRFVLRLAALVLVIGLTVLVYAVKDRAADLAIYGYPGVFLLAFLGYATVLLPAPVVVAVSAFSSVFHPLGIAIAAGSGAALGEFSGYLAGFSGQGIVEKAKIYKSLEYWMRKNGNLTILVVSAIPNPFFDLAGVAAGALKMRPLRFLFWCLLGEMIKMLFFAYGGAHLLRLFE